MEETGLLQFSVSSEDSSSTRPRSSEPKVTEVNEANQQNQTEVEEARPESYKRRRENYIGTGRNSRLES